MYQLRQPRGTQATGACCASCAHGGPCATGDPALPTWAPAVGLGAFLLWMFRDELALLVWANSK